MHPLVEVEHAVAAAAVGAVFVGDLGGLAVLAVQLPAQAVGEGRVQRVHFMRERHPRAGLPVVRLHAGGGDVVDGRQHVGVGDVLVALHGQAQALAVVGRIDQLGQHAAAVALLRIGCGAGVVGAAHPALVACFLALAVVDVDHAAPARAAEGGGHPAEQALPVAVVAQLQADVGALVVAQVIGRVLGDEGDHATQRVGAVQRTGRAAHDFHPLERFQVGEVAVGAGEAADGEAARHGDAVGLDQHAVAVQPADAEAAQAEAGHAAGHRDARFVADQVGDVVDELPVQLFAFDHIDRGGDVGDRAAGAGGGDLDAFQVVGIGRRGCGWVGMGGKQRRPQGGAQGGGTDHGHLESNG